MLDRIDLTRILKSNVIWENCRINFVSDEYDRDLVINKSHRREMIKDALVYEPFFPDFDFYEKLKRRQMVKAFVFLLCVIPITSLLGNGITFGDTLLPSLPDYWKYILIEVSFFSVILVGFIEFFEGHYAKSNWTVYRGMNERVFSDCPEEKCSLTVAKNDIIYILSQNSIDMDEEKSFPYGGRYYDEVRKALDRIDYKTNIETEYHSILSRISGQPGLFKTICSIVLGLAIQVITLIDLFDSLQHFLLNLSFCCVAFVFAAILISKLYVEHRYLKAYVRLDALLFVYSYRYLDMPISRKQKVILSTIDRESFSLDSSEAIIEFYADRCGKILNRHFCVRKVEIEGDDVVLYTNDADQIAKDLTSRKPT